jgi:hypothetical protein
MNAEIDANREVIKACQEVAEAWVDKGRPTRKSQEAIQERIKAIVEHYNWVPGVKATHHLTASNVLPRVPKGAMFKKTIATLEDRFGDQHLAIGYRSQPKSWTQDDSESLQEFATATEQFIHHAFPALLEDQVCRGPGNAFVVGIKA